MYTFVPIYLLCPCVKPAHIIPCTAPLCIIIILCVCVVIVQYREIHNAVYHREPKWTDTATMATAIYTLCEVITTCTSLLLILLGHLICHARWIIAPRSIFNTRTCLRFELLVLFSLIASHYSRSYWGRGCVRYLHVYIIVKYYC